jgi:hypothetical protein
MMRVSLRESRMVLERLVQVARVPEGMVPSLRDCALYSAALGLGGFEELLQNLELIKAPDLSRLSIDDDSTLDAGGLHAWLIAETALDLATASRRVGGKGHVRISNLLRPKELGVAAGFAARYDFATALESGPGRDVTLTVHAHSASDVALIDEIRRNGLPVAADLWWRLYHASAAALAPDTVSSRRHAGPIIITEDGKVIGRQDDDETDISLLTAAVHTSEPKPAA